MRLQGSAIPAPSGEVSGGGSRRSKSRCASRLLSNGSGSRLALQPKEGRSHRRAPAPGAIRGPGYRRRGPFAGRDVRQHRSLCRGSSPGQAGGALRAPAHRARLRREAGRPRRSLDPDALRGRPRVPQLHARRELPRRCRQAHGCGLGRPPGQIRADRAAQASGRARDPPACWTGTARSSWRNARAASTGCRTGSAGQPANVDTSQTNSGAYHSSGFSPLPMNR
jgi:hypothetical protein